MLRLCSGDLRSRAGMGIAGLASFVVLVWIGAASGQAWWTPPTASGVPSLGDGLVSGVFVAGAGCAAMVSWRRHAGRMAGWAVATGALLAGQALLVAIIGLQSAPPRSAAVQSLFLAVVLAGAVVVVGPLTDLRRVRQVVDETFVIGLGMGLVAAGHLLLQFPRAEQPTPLMKVTIGALIATHATVALLVLWQGGVARRPATLLGVTSVVVVLGQLVHPLGLSGTATDTALWISRTAVGAAWVAYGWCTIRRSLEEERRRIESVERVLVDATRDQRERLHELRSAVAGLVSGSQLLDREDLPADVRVRLWTSLRRELDRMERLLSGEMAAAADLPLDEALEVILDVQRLKGRQVELRSSGDVVRARFDALAEVVNILMDNAVKHGGTDSSIVEVVRRDEETVDITVTDFGRGIPREKRPQIFEWGGRASSAPGEGIGLHMAKRLMTEDGGSLSLAEREGNGSSFVISLPAARRSSENGLTMEDGLAWRRSG